MIWREFKAMGTEVVIAASLDAGQDDILIEAEKAVLDFEKRFSRFLTGNELSDLNDSRQENQEVSELMAGLLQEAKLYHLKTGGIFDPTIIGNLEAAGYDKSFEKIGSEIAAGNIGKMDAEKLKEAFLCRPKMSSISIEGRMVSHPLGFRVDLGGIGKGYIVDLLSRSLFSAVKDYWISAGGDIFVSGRQEDGRSWSIGVQNPHKPEENILLIDARGEKIGIATSGIIKRAGFAAGLKWHHIIDPRNGLPAVNNILSVTVISSSTVRADIFAKTILILGERDGLDFIEKENDSACVIFTSDKGPIFSERAGLYFKTYAKNE